MATFDDHEAGTNLDERVDDDHLIADAFDYTEEIESQFENLDADTEELNIPHFVGDLRALMVDDSDNEVVLDSDDEVVLDSDDEMISEKKEVKTRGRLWRRASAVSTPSLEIRSSAGSNLTVKTTDIRPVSTHSSTCYQEAPAGTEDTKTSKINDFDELNTTFNDFKETNEAINEFEEPDESSEANALKFVDQFVSISVINSSPEIKIPKIDALRSPLASCAKGSKNLAMKTNLLNQIGVSTFDWDNDQPDHGGEFFLKKEKELDIQTDKHSYGRYNKEGLQESFLLNSKRTYSSLQRDYVNEFDEEKLPENDAPDIFDVGFDTQMAAEAMESLLYAPPINIDSNENENLKKTPEKLHKYATNYKTSKKFSFFSTDSYYNSRTNGISYKQERVVKPEKSLKVGCLKKQKKDPNKENVQNEMVKPDKVDLIGRRQHKVKTFSPVACRTRIGSSVERSKRIKDAKCKRKFDDISIKFDTWNWPKKKRTCRNTKQNAKTGNELSVVGHSEIQGNFKVDFLSSSVKRKARSASKYKSMGNNLSKGLLMNEFGQQSLADITNTKSDIMSRNIIRETLDESENASLSLGGEERMKDLLLNKKSSSEIRSFDKVYVRAHRKQLHKKNSTSSSFKNELTRYKFSESSPDIMSKELRKRRNKIEIRVLFSQNLDDDVAKQQKKIMKKLGIFMATICSDTTHFVADRFARTKKMLEAMAFGKQIVTPLWLESCEQAECIIDEKNYILKDAKKEKEIGFNMHISLSRARSHPLLKDQKVLITRNVGPDREVIKNLVNAVQGQVIEGIREASMDHKISDNLLILSCEQDYAACVPLLDKGAEVYSSELLLNGIIIQKLEYARHKLFKDHVKMKRYIRKQKKNGSQHLHVAHGS